MASDLKTYPSGFVGSSLPVQVPPESKSESFRRMMDRTRLPGNDTRFTASAEVSQLGKLVALADPRLKEFESRVRVMQLFEAHMGAKSLDEWLMNQWRSGEFSDSHQRWVDETLGYVYGGRQRNLSNVTWASVLTAGGNTPCAGKKSQAHLSYLGSNNPDLREMMVFWLRRPGGIHDLTNSLVMLYGPR